MTTSMQEMYGEHHSRPSDTTWTAEQNARHAAARAETIRRADERQANKAIRVYRLTDGQVVATFWLDVRKQNVEIAYRTRNSNRTEEAPVIVSIEDAREQWQHLLDNGFSRC